MCNLYSMTRSQDAIRALFGVKVDQTGNLPSLPAVFPDQLAPVIRIGAGGRSLERMRWGFPPPPNSNEKVTTNVRHLESSWWRPWLKPEYRCIVPATSFCEYHDVGKKPHWFALNADRPLFGFAGIWRPWTGVRGTKAERKALLEETGSEGREHLVFAFLTTSPNELIRPVHAKAMPVILTGNGIDIWLEADISIARDLQHPAPVDQLMQVATGLRQDGAIEA